MQSLLHQYHLSPTFLLRENNPLHPYLAFQCSILFHKQYQNLQNFTKIWPPPRSIPSEYLDAFTLNGLLPVYDQYFAEESLIEERIWTNELIESFIINESTCGGYQSNICEIIVREKSHHISGKRGLILGSVTPWAEGLLFRYGASELITVEYMPILSNFPNLTVYTPAQLAEMYLLGQWAPVDFIFSFSSIEHDGLGRYGDPINPWGDLETIARLHCLVKDDGYLFLGVPSGRDTLVWNAHRVYGRYRLRILFQDWWVLRGFLNGANAEDELGKSFTLLLESEDQVNRIYPSFWYYESLWVLQKRAIN